MNWDPVSLDMWLWPLRATTYQQPRISAHQPNELFQVVISLIEFQIVFTVRMRQVRILPNDTDDIILDPKKKWAPSISLRWEVVRVYEWGGLGSGFSLNVIYQMPVFQSSSPNSTIQILVYIQTDPFLAYGSCSYENTKLRLPLSSDVLRAESDSLQMRWPMTCTFKSRWNFPSEF